MGVLHFARSLAALAFITCSLITLSTGTEESKCAKSEDGEDCSVTSNALLQARTSRSKGELHVGDRIEVEAYSGAKIVVHAECNNEWIIFITAGTTEDELKGLEEHMPEGSRPEYRGHPDHKGLPFLVMQGTEDQVKEELQTHDLSSEPLVECASTWRLPEGQSLLDFSASGDGGSPASWGLDRIDDREGLDQDYTSALSGSGAHVYVLDTGIRTTHSDFGGRAIPTLEIVSSTAIVCNASDTTCATDRQGHGTHCAGTVGGTSYGVAKNAQLHAVKVLSDSGSGSFAWFIEAIDWVLANGQTPAIISASLGGRGTLPSVVEAINGAVNGGIVVTVAAGNENDNACDYSPAGVPSAITVGATTSTDQRSGFSNYGSCLDIYAPGSAITSGFSSSDTATRTWDGTSMACPHVAGVSALLLGEDSTRSPADVLSLLTSRGTFGDITDAKPNSPNILLYTGSDTPAPTPPPPPPPPPTPAPTGDGWSVTSGECKFDENNCVMSPNFPQQYNHSQGCVIACEQTLGAITAVTFQTEANFDKLTIGSAKYHGSNGPTYVIPSGTISWSSDSSVASKGWKLCKATGPPPTQPPSPPTHSTQSPPHSTQPPTHSTQPPPVTQPPPLPVIPGPPGPAGPPGPPGPPR